MGACISANPKVEDPSQVKEAVVASNIAVIEAN
jgi:hypothetical protein